jgi:Adaptin N terminal region
MQIYQSFYCRMNDPSYIKDLKLQLLSAVADDSNAFEIVTELTEYVTDIDEHLAREAVRSVGRIALQVWPWLLLALPIWLKLKITPEPVCAVLLAWHTPVQPTQCTIHTMQVQDVSGLLDRLLNFLELGKDCVTAETLIQIKDLLRRYPHIAEVAIASVASISLQVAAV